MPSTRAKTLTLKLSKQLFIDWRWNRYSRTRNTCFKCLPSTDSAINIQS